MQKLRKLWESHPLTCIMLIALFVRLIAVIYSKGYGMHDDYFGPVGFPQEVLNNFSEWQKVDSPQQIIYPAVQYFSFLVLEKIGIYGPQDKMYAVRLLHGLYSLLIVYFGYKITHKLDGEKSAKKVGLILAMLWILPFMSVRNLVEIVCIPPVMAGFYLFLSEKKIFLNYFFTGFLFGVGFTFRFQAAFFPAGIAIVLIIQAITERNFKNILNIIYLSIGFTVSSFLLLGIPDWLKWGYPFANLMDYVLYNASHGYDYIVGPWYNYILLMIGILIPPLSLLLLYGFLRCWKKYYMLFIPIMIFFIFHSYFPNKQERFILPVVPLIIILSVIGWENFAEKSIFWMKHKKLLKSFWVWFWIVNTILLTLFSTTYTKRTRVETMTYLSNKDVKALYVVCGRFGHITLPVFYLKRNIPQYAVLENSNCDSIMNEIKLLNEPVPNYAIFYDDNKLEVRVSDFQRDFRIKLKFEKEIEPSFIDDILFKLNPKGNKNQAAYIYKIEN